MSTRNLTAVEGLRFFLFLGIFVFHCISRWFPIGWGGVEAFLVIGSFFLTNKYLGREQSEIRIGGAFWHRIKRLYPAYLTIVLVFSVGLIYHTRSLSVEPLWYIFSVQNFRCLFESATYSLDSFLGHFWYICLDVWLFLIWVIIMRLIPNKHLRVAFILSIGVGLLWRTLFICFRPDNAAIAYMIPIGQLDSWALGGLVALNIREKGNRSRTAIIEIVIGVVGIIALTGYNAYLKNEGFYNAYQLWHSASGYILNPITGNIHFLIALLSAGLLRYCIDTTKKHPILSAAPLVALGGMSYELYCFHFPIRYVARHFIQNEIIMIIAALIATYIVSVLWVKLAMPVIKRVIK